MFFLSGLPRTGSTLLSSILSQNPEIYAGGNSPVCQLMWDMQVSCKQNAAEQLASNRRLEAQDDLIKAIPYIYYKNVNQKYIVDKCRSWTLPANLEMIKRYITDKPKILVLTRDLDEIINSFARIRKANNWQGPLKDDLLIPDSEPVMRSLNGVNWAKENNNGEFFFIDYLDLVANPKIVLQSVYDFFEVKPFKHNFENIVNLYPEDDFVYGLMGLHEVRPKVGLLNELE